MMTRPFPPIFAILLLQLLVLASAPLTDAVDPVLLTAGTPKIDSVSQTSRNTYKVSIPDASPKPLTFLVTPFGTGDPDLFASVVDADPSSPGKQGVSYGGDAVTFQVQSRDCCLVHPALYCILLSCLLFVRRNIPHVLHCCT